MCDRCIDSIKLCGTCAMCNIGSVPQPGPCDVVIIICMATGKETDGCTECASYQKSDVPVLQGTDYFYE